MTAEAAADREQPEREVTFEVYVLRRRRWLIYQVVHERDPAVKLAQALAGERENEAVRVVRDELDVRSGESKAVVILDTELHVPQPPEPPEPRFAPRRPTTQEPKLRRRAPPPVRGGPPWFALISAGLVIAFAGLGLLFFVPIS